MQLSLVRSLLLAFTGTVLVPGVGETNSGAFQEGDARGTWDLPIPGANGQVLGTLFDSEGDLWLHFQAGLVAAPALCQACQTGLVAGTLDDGIGSGPDFLVDGLYVGVVAYGIGLGGFDLAVRTPTGD